jgi:hypothetical protein
MPTIDAGDKRARTATCRWQRLLAMPWWVLLVASIAIALTGHWISRHGKLSSDLANRAYAPPSTRMIPAPTQPRQPIMVARPHATAVTADVQ